MATVRSVDKLQHCPALLTTRTYIPICSIKNVDAAVIRRNEGE